MNHAEIASMPSQSRLAITYIPPAGLKPSLGNPRQHSKKQINQIARSIKAFGFSVPVLVGDGGQILSGHARVLAALKLNIPEVPTVHMAHMTPEQARAFMIADNRLSEQSNWDDGLLAEALKELSDLNLDFSMEDTGFTLDEIDLRIESLNGTDGDTLDPDDQVADTSDAPNVCTIGDVWILGQHRVAQGDATELADIEKLMKGHRATMAVTDPPYNVNYGASAKDKLRGTARPILNDDLGADFGDFLQKACANILAVTDGGIYICMSSSELHTLHDSFVRAGGKWSTFIIWGKNSFTMGRSDYQRQYEPILYGWKEGVDRYWCGARNHGDLWSVNRPVKNDLHPTMKPVELLMKAIRNSSRRGDIILDPFLGSGSTLIAAERTGRVCYGMELDPRYVDVIVRRWQQHTGEEAVHAITGEKFNDIANGKKE